jgi:hypothetical protein
LKADRNNRPRASAMGSFTPVGPLVNNVRSTFSSGLLFNC